MPGDRDIELLDLDLEVFQGPFDLLLSLVLREEVSIFEVSLADIVISYLQWLEEKDELDLEAASEFLVLISALMEIKSAQLLPRPEEEGFEELTPEEAREELVARLITYRKFKEAAAWLAGRFAETRHWHFRQAPLPKVARRTEPEVKQRYGAARLADAIGLLLAEPPQVRTDHITQITVNVWERMKAIREAVRKKSRVAFDDLVGDSDRMTQAVTFFALLEMFNSGELEVEQEQLFGQILIYEARKQKIA